MTTLSFGQVGSALNSLGRKSVRPSCGGLVLGGGAFVTPQFANLGLTQIPGGGKGFAGAVETDAVPGSWRVSGQAFCAGFTRTRPSQAGPGPYIKSVQVVAARSRFNSAGSKAVTVHCPTGKQVIAGGGALVAHGAAFRSMRSTGARSDWRVIAGEVDPTNLSWWFEGRAICANVTTASGANDYVGTPITVIGLDSVPSSAPGQTTTVQCPSASRAIGGGAAVRSASAHGKVVLTVSEPVFAGGSYGWKASAQETDPISRKWQVHSQVICAPVDSAP
jgi:rhodanese-related sulfurtransferase